MGKEYRAFLLSIDPQKRANCVKRELITDCVEDTQNNLFSFKSEFSRRELKVKLGIVNESDLVEVNGEQTKIVDKIESKGDQKKESQDSKMTSAPEQNGPKLKLEIPVLGETSSFQEIQTYCEDIKTFKKLMKDQWTDEEIIFSSLVKSKKTSLKVGMNKSQSTKIDDFIQFLFTNYGYNQLDLWKKLRNIRQLESEGILQFFNRTVNLFFACRNLETPESIDDTAHKNEIRNIFISGLRDAELRKQLNMNQVGITFEKLGETALAYQQAIISAGEISSALKVMKIDTAESNYERSFDRSRSHSRGRYDSRNRSRSREYESRRYDRSRSRDRYRDRSGDRGYSQETRGCFRCGRQGHKIRECRASARTVSDYHKRLQRSRSRDEPRVRFEE